MSGTDAVAGETNFPWDELLITTSLVKDTAHAAAAQTADTMHKTPQQGVGHCDCNETIQCGKCADVSDNDELDDEYNESFDHLCSITHTVTGKLSPDEDENVIPMHIEGTPLLQARLKELCRQHEAIFSRSIRSTPAKLPPI